MKRREGFIPDKEVEASEGAREFLKRLFSQEQMNFLNDESTVSEIELDDNAQIHIPDVEFSPEDGIQLGDWKKKDGVLDASIYKGAIIVVYNSREHLPDGCRDLFSLGRSGEYDAETKLCFVDTANTLSYFDRKYMPSWVQQFVRHELRHHMVTLEDERYSDAMGVRERRNIDSDDMEEEQLRQLYYLDEVHSQFFDAIDGDIADKDSFRSLGSEFMCLTGVGSHTDIASATPEGQKVTEDLFYYAQGFILLKRMLEESNFDMGESVELMINAAGVTFATERTIVDAKDKTKVIWDKLMDNTQLRDSFVSFLENYSPRDSGYNTPEITDELKQQLGIK